MHLWKRIRLIFFTLSLVWYCNWYSLICALERERDAALFKDSKHFSFCSRLMENTWFIWPRKGKYFQPPMNSFTWIFIFGLSISVIQIMNSTSKVFFAWYLFLWRGRLTIHWLLEQFKGKLPRRKDNVQVPTSTLLLLLVRVSVALNPFLGFLSFHVYKV